jgi:hypothetical protein
VRNGSAIADSGRKSEAPASCRPPGQDRRPCGNCPTGRQSSLKKLGSNISNDPRHRFGGDFFIWAIFFSEVPRADRSNSTGCLRSDEYFVV